MKQVGKLLEMVLVVSLCLGTSAMFAMQQEGGDNLDKEETQELNDTEGTEETSQHEREETSQHKSDENGQRENDEENEKENEKNDETGGEQTDSKNNDNGESTTSSSSTSSSSTSSSSTNSSSTSSSSATGSAVLTSTGGFSGFRNKIECRKNFNLWWANAQNSPKCVKLAKVVGIGVVAYFAWWIWVAASAYCAAGNVDAISEVLVCPAVGYLNWMYAGVVAFFYGLYESAIKWITENCDGEFFTNTTNSTNTTNTTNMTNTSFDPVNSSNSSTNLSDLFGDNQGNTWPNGSADQSNFAYDDSEVIYDNSSL